MNGFKNLFRRQNWPVLGLLVLRAPLQGSFYDETKCLKEDEDTNKSVSQLGQRGFPRLQLKMILGKKVKVSKREV